MQEKDSKNILVVGGAGYIGSHTVARLLEKGYNPIVVDNLSTGHKKSVFDCVFYELNACNKEALKEVFNKHKIHNVIHFAANCYIGESVVNPHKYFKNNLISTLTLLDLMLEYGITNIIYSSTASVFGTPKYLPIDENHPMEPVSPYGMSVKYIEEIINTYEKAYGIKHIHLRYFNAAGSDIQKKIGEDHYPETHIIPLLMKTALGQRKKFTVFGNDYETKDGTCIRDYIHVNDLASAHINALEYLQSEEGVSNDFNLGISVGYSVKDIVNKVIDISGINIEVEYAKRRHGDTGVLIASSKKAREVLRWEPKHGLDDIIKSSWEWHSKYPKGYAGII